MPIDCCAGLSNETALIILFRTFADDRDAYDCNSLLSKVMQSQLNRLQNETACLEQFAQHVQVEDDTVGLLLYCCCFSG